MITKLMMFLFIMTVFVMNASAGFVVTIVMLISWIASKVYKDAAVGYVINVTALIAMGIIFGIDSVIPVIALGVLFKVSAEVIKTMATPAPAAA
ncbi:hypothetical protein TOTORO_00780 [Serratia phage vB_SmaS-Totoro]|nr:hypothetical protein TOTORO_00780 [Serratia phage vB_SmaS-Totoro]